MTFCLPHGTGTGAPGSPARVNPTSEPSQIVDLGQWLTLFRSIAEAAERESDKVQARHLGLEAAQCLDEALKFYYDVGKTTCPTLTPSDTNHRASVSAITPSSSPAAGYSLCAPSSPAPPPWKRP